jgi:SAM-dependent methyltransferase
MVDTHQILIDSSNANQFQAWDGDEGAYWAAHAEHFEAALTGYDGPFFAAAAIGDTARVLDIGCGTGRDTREAGRRARAGSALGVDLSSAMLDVARRTAQREGLHNVRFEQADAQIHPFDKQAFDVAISRTTAMFFGDPLAAFTNIGHALRPAGRLVLLLWQSLPGNEWIRKIRGALAAGRDLPAPPPGAPGPFALSDPDRARSLLSAGGFTDIELDGLEEPMYFGPDPDAAHQVLSGQMGWMVQGLDETRRAHALDALYRTLQAHHTERGVAFGSAAWLITATRP